MTVTVALLVLLGLFFILATVVDLRMQKRGLKRRV